MAYIHGSEQGMLGVDTSFVRFGLDSANFARNSTPPDTRHQRSHDLFNLPASCCLDEGGCRKARRVMLNLFVVLPIKNGRRRLGVGGGAIMNSLLHVAKSSRTYGTKECSILCLSSSYPSRKSC